MIEFYLLFCFLTYKVLSLVKFINLSITYLLECVLFQVVGVELGIH